MMGLLFVVLHESLAAACSALTRALGWYGYFHVAWHASFFRLSVNLSSILLFSNVFFPNVLLFLMFHVDSRSVFCGFLKCFRHKFCTGRMLLCVRERSISDSHSHSSLQRQFSHGHGQKFDDGGSGSGTRVSHFLPTSRRIVQFSNGKVCYRNTVNIISLC